MVPPGGVQNITYRYVCGDHDPANVLYSERREDFADSHIATPAFLLSIILEGAFHAFIILSK